MSSLQKYVVPAVFALLGNIFFSCDRQDRPKREIDEATFRAILVDAFLAEAYVLETSSYRQFNAAKLMNHRIYPYLYKKHGVDSAAFSGTFDYYLRRPDVFRELLARVNDTLNARLEQAPAGNPLPPPPPVPEEIRSDTMLVKDAAERYKLFEKIKQGQAQDDKKSN